MHTVSVVMVHTSQPLQLTFILYEQALLLQSEHLKTRILIVGINPYTALLISSHAHSLCDHYAQFSLRCGLKLRFKTWCD